MTTAPPPPRIIAGLWRGKALTAPTGLTTRPTSARVRQALFDILLHASWGGPAFVRRARVLDVFAGTGALGLEALSRGAGQASFMEQDRTALASLRANIVACRAESMSHVFPIDATAPPRGVAHDLIMLDPPYGQNLIPLALSALDQAGWLAKNAVIIAEFGKGDEQPDDIDRLADRQHGAASLVFWRRR
ncbi:MAG: 16S rRNA (guanine(966)-N(2))-methyltransferase RsmD [Rhodospirillales bacterium 20-60-12]|nr:MAG: 16S rRNA (guanine(966)-N(2))-methyltransferase RsmD [Rhodospirillales bacterium 20-60-12]OYV62091.1 MAG: 16S rRNA (guanine(966)-N(2))-methyltransferase RsmD [Acidiphilium sp. 21-62-4]HQT66347.1 16S rRNA (guanine(966)-N(2))-methyltransferase RsmD [Acetobacteraceae bacterium]HQU01272.1 16S rRNA (guanine(966)-N(2))-methyltransferase RsmD [Acetobacteraceae bacterium]